MKGEWKGREGGGKRRRGAREEEREESNEGRMEVRE